MLSEQDMNQASYTYPDPPEGEPEKYFAYHTLSGFLQAKSEQFENNASVEFQLDDDTWKSLGYGQLDWLTSRLAYTLYKTMQEQSHFVLTKDITVEAAKSLIGMTQTKVVFAGHLYADLISSAPVYPFPILDHSALLEPTTQEQEMAMMEKFKVHTADELGNTGVIVHSLGTIAFPKPVHLNNKYMLFICQAVIVNHQSRNHLGVCPTEKSKNMCIFPIFHAGGVINVLRFFIVGGCHSYLNHYSASSKAIVKYIKQEKEVAVTAPLWILEKLAVYKKETNDIESFQKNVIFFE
ncbi:hypothetical protein CU098_011481 [Rhizopus stolonifer]|uniref:AMP-dependent synthetase/ligase domain-containing protein n=1 Tax=Rhizopus stolonifer TaxID=4846 RepID=A0A367KE77_RHIST|nr:hypothetical protein CU098_011481 [Rhizopus stolonifer]